MPNRQRVELTVSSVLKFFGVALAILFLWYVLDIIALLFVVMIIVAALGPAVEWLVRQSLPRVVAVTLIYILIFLVIGFLFSLILPPLVDQLHALTIAFPSIVQRLTPLYQVLLESNTQQLIQSLSSELSAVTQGLFSATAQLFGGVAAFFTVLVISFYMLLDAKQARDALVLMLPPDRVKSALTTLTKINDRLGSWFRGQVALSVLITVVTYFGLVILGVPYALTLAVLAGILEVVPFIGPIIAGIVAILVAYAAGSWQLATGTLIFSVIVQQLENNLFVPKIMQSAVGLSPVLVIIALAVGAKLGGVTGAILAVPLAAVLSVAVQEWPRLRNST